MHSFLNPGFSVAPAPNTINKGKYNKTTKGSVSQLKSEKGNTKAKSNNTDKAINPNFDLIIQFER